MCVSTGAGGGRHGPAFSPPRNSTTGTGQFHIPSYGGDQRAPHQCSVDGILPMGRTMMAPPCLKSWCLGSCVSHSYVTSMTQPLQVTAAAGKVMKSCVVLRHNVTKYVRAYPVCQRAKPRGRLSPEQLQTVCFNRPWKIVACDVMESFPLQVTSNFSWLLITLRNGWSCLHSGRSLWRSWEKLFETVSMFSFPAFRFLPCLGHSAQENVPVSPTG